MSKISSHGGLRAAPPAKRAARGRGRPFKQMIDKAAMLEGHALIDGPHYFGQAVP